MLNGQRFEVCAGKSPLQWRLSDHGPTPKHRSSLHHLPGWCQKLQSCHFNCSLLLLTPLKIIIRQDCPFVTTIALLTIQPRLFSNSAADCNRLTISVVNIIAALAQAGMLIQSSTIWCHLWLPILALPRNGFSCRPNHFIHTTDRTASAHI
jgi:hypothetical protein